MNTLISNLIAALEVNIEMHRKGITPPCHVVDLTGSLYRNGLLIEEDKLTGGNDNDR